MLTLTQTLSLTLTLTLTLTGNSTHPNKSMLTASLSAARHAHPWAVVSVS